MSANGPVQRGREKSLPLQKRQAAAYVVVVIGNNSAPTFKAVGDRAAVRARRLREQEGRHEKHKNSQKGRDQLFVALCVFCGHPSRQQPAAEITQDDGNVTVTPSEPANSCGPTSAAPN